MLTETLYPVYYYTHLNKNYHVLVIGGLDYKQSKEQNNQEIEQVKPTDKIIMCSYIENNGYLIQDKYDVKNCIINFIYSKELTKFYFLGLYSEIRIDLETDNNVSVPVYKSFENNSQIIIISVINNNVLIGLTENYESIIPPSYDINSMYLKLINRDDMSNLLFIGFSKWFNTKK